MLKASREARKVQHQHAAYTPEGKLLCKLCQTIVKTDAAWDSHLQSSQHNLHAARARAVEGNPATDATSKKRKASTLNSPVAVDRKKPKPTQPPQSTSTSTQNENTADETDLPTAATVSQPSPPGASDEVDMVQLAALDEELAALEAAESAAYITPTISAPPMTADEIAAQEKEKQSVQRGKRDAELEAEREDAAKLLEDEFEEMEGLEERAKKLRDRRETLRRMAASSTHISTVQSPKLGAGEHLDRHDDEDDEALTDDEFDEWNFGGR
jgi:hypothetical protein